MPVASSSSSSSDDETGSLEKSFEKVAWSGNHSRRSPEGSDVWHSESEANWTHVEASLRNGRDIVQSQILSEGLDLSINGGSLAHQRRPSVTFNDFPLAPKQKGALPTFSEREEEEQDRGEGVRKEPPPSSRDAMLAPASHVITPMENVDSGGTLASPQATVSAVDGHTLNFLPPGSVEVFGSCSWNTLPLAVGSNQVQGKTPGESARGLSC